MAAFKKEILTRFIGTDEGEVTEYLGCELIRNRSAKTAKLVQRGYAERVLRTFGMWDCKPCATPLDQQALKERLSSGKLLYEALSLVYDVISVEALRYAPACRP
jgi:hypothetical protein